MTKSHASKPSAHTQHHTQPHEEPTRRDFMMLTAASMAAIGAGSAAWTFIDSMNPSADVLSLSSIEVDLSPIQLGQTVKVKWRGIPLYIRHRTQEDIAAAKAVPMSALKDPATDQSRTKSGHEEWLVMSAVCTHLGCITIFNAGMYHDGWFCPCHGSQYDQAGRIRHGPAPQNLPVPDYVFLTGTRIRIG